LSNGNYVTTGQFSSNGFYAANLTNTGTVEWENSYGNGTGVGYSIDILQDNSGFIFAGFQTNTQKDFFLVKTNNSGNSFWTNTIPSENGGELRSIVSSPDGGFAAFGTNNMSTLPKYYLLKTDKNGNFK